MIELIIYDREMNRKGILENQTSILWVRKYFEPGNFEIHAPITQNNLNLLAKGNLVTKKGNVEAGIIESIENNESDNLNEIIIKGRFLSSYMDRRLIKDTLTFNGLTEDAMKLLVRTAEPIPMVQIQEKSNGFENEISFQATMKNLLTLETKLAKGSNIGYRFKPDFKNKKILFELYRGTDRTISQNLNSRVIFSESYDNLNKAIYRWTDQLL